MTDSSDIAAKAREALEGITPGEWAASPPLGERWPGNYWSVGTPADGLLERVTLEAGSGPDDERFRRVKADARFIAAAPDLVRSLLAALETAETTNAHFPHAARVLYRAGRIISGTEAAPEDPYHLVNDLVDLAELFEKAGGVS